MERNQLDQTPNGTSLFATCSIFKEGEDIGSDSPFNENGDISLKRSDIKYKISIRYLRKFYRELFKI